MLRRVLLVSTICSVGTGLSYGTAHADSVRGHYQAFVNKGCKVATVNTPIEARILRNVPFAVAGKKFRSPELRFLFASDGSWYRATARKVKLSRVDRRCVGRLAKREAKLRQRLPIDRNVERVLTRSRKIFFGLRTMGTAPKLVRARSRASKSRWSWSVEDAAACGGSGTPGEAGDCSSFTFTCELPTPAASWSSLQCDVAAAG